MDKNKTGKVIKYELKKGKIEAMDTIAEDLEDAARRHGYKIMYYVCKVRLCGPDYIPTKVVKSILTSILVPLTKLVNLSFKYGVFPDTLKRARIIVLYKGGPRNDPANHRPISILSVFSKIFEKAMLSRLLNFLKSKKIPHDYQFGFRMKHSTEHACMTLLNFIHSTLDSGLISAAIFLNIRKAFDSLTHEILLLKMSHFGIRGNVFSWFLVLLEK